MSRRSSSCVLAFLLAFSLCAAVKAAVWSSTDRWGTWTSGAYTLYNNVWGSGFGPQTIWANSATNWGVWANHPNTGGIKSYPNCSRTINKTIDSSNLSGSFNVSRPGSGAYNTSYDIWVPSEVMVWVNKQGAVGPIGSLQQSNVSVGGGTWNVYRGGNNVVSFIRTSNTNSGTLNLKQILQWAKSKGWYGNGTIGKCQLGFEITSSSGGLNFVVNSMSTNP